jgi:hypothetical protein
MMKIRLAIREGGHVADVEIPPFQSLPEVIVWGQRFFSFYSELSGDVEPCTAEYREVFAYWVPPAISGQEPVTR